MCSHHSSYHTDIELHWWWKHQRHRCRVLCSRSDRNYPHHIFLKMARNVAVSLSVHPSLKCLLNKCFISDSRLQSWRQILGDFQQKAWERSRLELTHLPSPKNSVAQSSSLKIAQLVSQCCSRGQIGCNTATVPASVHFIVACVVYYLNDPVSASCEVFLVSSVVASRLATAFLTGN